MAKSFKNTVSGLLCGTALALAFTATSAQAEDDKVSASMGASYNSHFISYGGDVWGGGDDFFGSNSTSFVWGDVGFELPAGFTFNVGVWADVNSNAPSAIGGSIQEIDWYGSLGYTVGKFGLGVTYQEWNYAGEVEGVLDLAVSFDDSELLPISFAPSLTWHNRIDPQPGQGDGSALVLGVGPSFSLTEGEYALSLTIPVNVAYFIDDFAADDGYAYTSGGLSFGIPLAFMGSSYGEWSANFDLIYYSTEADVLPGNPEEDFLTGSIGFSVAF